SNDDLTQHSKRLKKKPSQRKILHQQTQFLQVHGRAYKIHLDSAVALAAESPVNMMPWQGDTNNMIDRFDVRAHLDYIPMYTPSLVNTSTPEQESEERKCNYERYRGLVQNDFANISEEQCLYQIYVDELYGGLQKPNEDEKKKLAEKKAQIGYTYEDSTVTESDAPSEKGDEDNSENSESEEDEVIPDIDVEVDVDELNPEQVMELNKMATPYGMAEGDFVWMLRKDKEEVEAIKHAKALEAEKAMYSGRRSRRQRREFREKYMKGRQISPPSYARRDSPTYDPYKRTVAHNDQVLVFLCLSSRRRSSSSRSSYSSRSSSRRSSRSSSRSRRSRRGWGYRDRDGRRSRSRSHSRRRSDSRSRQRGSGGSTRRRYEHTRSRSTDRDRDRDRGRHYTARRRTSRFFFFFFQVFRQSQLHCTALCLIASCLLQPKMTPQEKLKLRMQKALNKQSKADKKAAQIKIQQQEHKRQEREGVLRAMARKIRMNKKYIHYKWSKKYNHYKLT
uniref:Suppressor of white apricot N-terminal domain-containing protein n=1 Tax=Pygocentrus nattereri TaxID=42514 RepID=A0AAR2INL8_PYGNA